MDANLTFKQHFIKNFKKLSRVAFHCVNPFLLTVVDFDIYH